MANCEELKSIAEARVQSAKFLIEAKDWDGAAYMMGYGLECMLKSVICNTLNLKKYPDTKDNDWFLTHKLDRLLLLSGLENIFGVGGPGFEAWSGFTNYYQGEWPSMRYEPKALARFDEQTTLQLFEFLTCTDETKEGIIPAIIRTQNAER